MKKFILLFFILFMPIFVNAESFTTLDISMNIPENEWYVFTRGNIDNNSELDKLGVTSEYMKNYLKTNNLYVNGINKKNNIELYVVATKNDVKYNLHKYSNKKVKEMVSEISNLKGIEKYSVYKTSGYKYFYFEYFDTDYYLQEYATYINGYNYNIKFQKKAPFTSIEKNDIQTIIDNVSFIYNSKYEGNPKDSQPFITSGLIIISVIGVGIFAVLVAIKRIIKGTINKRKMAKSDKAIIINGCYLCPNCKNDISYGDKYCNYCAKEINWNGVENLCINKNNYELEEIDENDEFFKEKFEFSYAKVKKVLKKLGYDNYATFKKYVYESKKIKRKKLENKEDEVNYLVKALGYENFEDFYNTNI